MARSYGQSRIPAGMVPVVNSHMGRRSDLTGRRYGKLVAIEKIGKVRTNAVWRLACDCGGFAVANTGDLKKGNAKSCGCLMGRRSIDPSESEIAEMVAIYSSGAASMEVAKAFGVSPDFVLNCVREADERVRKHRERVLDLREDAFREITPESAYWAGFLFADGHVSTSGGRSGTLKVTLAAKDIGHLEKLRSFLGSGHALQSYLNTGGHPACALHVQNQPLADGLAALGMEGLGPVRLPVYDLIWSRDFWRGAVDGDGSVLRVWRRSRTQQNEMLQLVGSREFIDLFRNFVRFYCPESNMRPRKDGAIWKYAVKCRVARTMIRVLYEGATVYLDRKYDKAIEIARLESVAS